MISYRPASLVSFVCHEAVLASNERRFALFITKHRKSLPKQNDGGLHSMLDRPSRNVVRLVERLVNQDRQPDSHPRRLVAFYDSVIAPGTHVRRRAQRATDLDDAAIRTALDVDQSVPGHYLVETYAAGVARTKPEVLLRGAALRSFLDERGYIDLRTPAFKPGDAPLEPLEGVSLEQIVRSTVSDLAIVACEPTASGGLEATRLIAETGSLGIEEIRRHFDTSSPLAWRLLRVVSETLRRHHTWDGPQPEIRDPGTVRRACEALLRQIDDDNPPGVYRARSLFEEAVGLFPKASTDFNDWAEEVLHRRALMGKSGSGDRESRLPVRERMTAAWVYLWRVARKPMPGSDPDLQSGPTGWVPQLLTPLGHSLPEDRIEKLQQFAVALQGNSDDRGLVYAGEFIEAALAGAHFWYPHSANDAKLLGHAPVEHSFWSSTPEVQMVREAINATIDAEISEPFLRDSLSALVGQACLTIDGVSRRESLTAIQYAGLGEVAGRAFMRIAEHTDSRNHRWLVEVATFCLGWVTDPASNSAMQALIDIAGNRRLDVSIRMTALMSLGDSSGQLRHSQKASAATGVAIDAARSALDTYPRRGANPHDKPEKVLLRSALYALAMLRHDPGATVPLLADVTRLGAEFFGESATPGLAQWGLDRFNVQSYAANIWAGNGPPPDLVEQLAHQGEEVTRGRRIVDPLRSMNLVDAPSAPQPMAGRTRRQRATQAERNASGK